MISLDESCFYCCNRNKTQIIALVMYTFTITEGGAKHWVFFQVSFAENQLLSAVKLIFIFLSVLLSAQGMGYKAELNSGVINFNFITMHTFEPLST